MYPPISQTDSKCDVGNGLTFDKPDGDDDDQVLEEMNHFPDPVSKRRGAKSFSSLRHPVDGLRTLGRRLSVTIRNKSSRHNLQSLQDASLIDPIGQNHDIGNGSWPNAWLNGLLPHRRSSANSVSNLQGLYTPGAAIPAPIPGNGLEHPPILPNDSCSGAAARAAAAAQNELTRAKRNSKMLESRLIKDTESGIEIDLHDRSDYLDADSNLVRAGTSPCMLIG